MLTATVLLAALVAADADAIRVRIALELAAAESKAPAPSGYDAAYWESLETGKPLIVWVGGNFCDRCVEDSKGEFLHAFVDDWHGQRGPATVLLVPGGDGHVYRAATATKWTVGSKDWGHIPSARRLLAEWRERAGRGNKSPLVLLDFGDGGKWGMSHDAYWRHYAGPVGYSGVPFMQSGRPSGGRFLGGFRSGGGSCGPGG